MARPKSACKHVPVHVVVPPSVRDAVETAARAKYETVSGYTRAALLARLERDGICPIPPRAT
jgi:hypothetical protein